MDAEGACTVAVRALCEFTAKRGDLDLRFTPAPTAQEGMAGHRVVGARRPAGYEAELSLSGRWGPLTVRGRADGYHAAANRLEEIKTHRGDLARQPENHRHLHWAQLKVYGALLCQQRGLPQVELALVYYDIATQDETVIAQMHDATSLQAFFESQCSAFVAWARQEAGHRQARDAALRALQFPHAGFRDGQRALAEAVYRGADRGVCVMAQAPTGIGKTVGTLFPMLKACPTQRLDKVFYLAAKTPGRQLALDAMARFAASDAPQGLRVLELTARDKACEHPDKACHGDSCPLARGFYDRLPAARADALGRPRLDRAAVREHALRHAVCPYYLQQELVRWADVVVGDYNYYFDTTALLHALASDNEWRVGVLVDEAHNLLDRARKMYSAELDPQVLRSARRAAPPALKKPLAQLARLWNAWARGHTEAYVALDELPAGLERALAQAGAALAEHLAQAPAQPAPELQRLYFDLLAFARLAESFGEHSMVDLTRAGPGPKADTVLCIRNLVPAPFLAPRFAAARSVTLFSATLGPPGFYRDTLGLPPDTAWVDVASPFDPQQLAVRVVRHISTRFPDRAASAAPIARLIGTQYALAPGNYLAFFSSFDYLQQVAAQFAQAHPDIPRWEQSRGMTEAERQAFLARFEPAGRGVGFAVLGGSFAEGIDLPGDRLVGAFIATLGLPQVNPVNEQIMQRMERAFGAGYDYAYLYPGLQKVVQAAGRVIRTRDDRGVVMLIDDRFGRPAVRALLPAWWQVVTDPRPGNTELP